MAQVRRAEQPQFYFDDDSAIWTINRERVLLLTGARVLLMQLAHPMVAEAVYHHSYVFRNPLKRLHRTLTLTLGMVYGTTDEVAQAVAEIERAHRPATGRIEQAIGQHHAGAAYNPRNPRQAWWVWATLVEGAISGYETLVAPLPDERKTAFIEDSARIAGWMGIPGGMLQRTYPDLVDAMQAAIDAQEIIVGDKARAIAPTITVQSIPVLKWLAYPVHRFNIALLPDDIRDQYGYTPGTREGQLVERVCAFGRRILPHIPPLLRYAPEYRRARRLLTASDSKG